MAVLNPSWYKIQGF